MGYLNSSVLNYLRRVAQSRLQLFYPALLVIFLAGCIGGGGGNDEEAAANTPPIVEAGPGLSIALPGMAILDATVTDDGLPQGSSLSYAWSMDGGPGTVTFANSNAVDTSATFSSSGSYVLRLSASDGSLSASDTVSVDVTGATNVAPQIDTGPDQSISLRGTATLDATVTDDGFPQGSTLTYLWSMDSGSGSVAFTNENAVDTTATFTAAGIYILRLTADDGVLNGSDTVMITVINVPNVAPQVYAGPDLSVSLSGTSTLDATVIDDGLPQGGGADILMEYG